MKTIEIIGYYRKSTGKSDSKRLRNKGNVPCILYGDKKQIYFYSPIVLFKDIIYSFEVNFVNLNIEGNIYKCILQDIQFHPVSETILHADFLKLSDDKKLKMNIPIKLFGKIKSVSEGGGTLVQKMKTLKVLAYPKNVPSSIDLNVDNLIIGNSIKVKDIKKDKFEILNFNLLSVILITKPPRSLKAKSNEEAKDKNEKKK